MEQIVANGMGYEANGSVYFDTQAFRCVPAGLAVCLLATASCLLAAAVVI